MITTPNLGLKVWNLTTDPYDSGQLADNWAKVDEHDHASGRGKQIPTAGIEDGAITTSKLAIGANITPDASVTTAKLASEAVTSPKIASEAWTSYTPSLTNGTVGSGTLTAAYYRVGRLINFKILWTLGAGSAVSGAITFTLPVTAVAGTGGRLYAYIADASPAATYPAFAAMASTSTITVNAVDASATYAKSIPTTSTVPITFTTSDVVYVSGAYEAAS